MAVGVTGVAVATGVVTRGSGGGGVLAAGGGSFWSLAFPLPFEKKEPILCRNELFTRVDPEPDPLREDEGDGGVPPGRFSVEGEAAVDSLDDVEFTCSTCITSGCSSSCTGGSTTGLTLVTPWPWGFWFVTAVAVGWRLGGPEDGVAERCWGVRQTAHEKSPGPFRKVHTSQVQSMIYV